MNQKEQLKALVDKYREYKSSNRTGQMSEESTRLWINRFLEIFDWDVLNTQQIQQEKIVDEGQKYKLDEINSIHTKPDYTLTNGSIVKAYLDAKKVDVDIFKSKGAAFQVRSYGWSAGLPCSFLSNFEQLVIFDCRYAPKKGEDANIGAIQISMDNYVDEFDVINAHLNRDLVYKNNLQKLYSTDKIEGTQTVDFYFNKLLSEFRIILANEMYANNCSLIDEEELNYYVQIIIDRIVFIRVCESRKIEKEGLLKDFVKRGFWNTFKQSCYAEFFEHYDGAMFAKDDKFYELTLSNDIFVEFICKLYYPYPYRFDAIPTKIIAKVYEEFLAYLLCVKGNRVVAELKADYVKTNGAIPTQEYIADAICKETLAGRKIKTEEDIFDIKILDPCCGSGVFLVSAYEFLADALMATISVTNKWCIVAKDNKYLTIAAKQEIMKKCLYGIDYDSTAVEVTKMSLALKVIDDANDNILSEIGIFGDKILNDIHQNIVNGNTLVDVDIDCSVREIKYIRPLNIKNTVYKKVFDEKGGFDFVVGNPPYVETKFFKAASPTIYQYLKQRYKTFEGKVDLSVLFIERAMELLNDSGRLGVIIQRRWFKTKYGKGARKFISDGAHLLKLLDIQTNALFKGRITYVSIMILTKKPNSKVYYDFIKGNPTDVQAYFEAPDHVSEIDSDYFSEDAWAPELKQIFEIKNKYAAQYGTVGSNDNISIRDGVQALWKKVYDITDYTEELDVIVGKNGFGENVKIEKEMVKPVIYNREFIPLKEMAPDAYRIFPYKGADHKTKMTISEIQSDYPLAYDYLSKNKQKIMQYVRCNPGEYWTTYTREHNHDSFDSDKIIIPMTAKETYATYVCNKGIYMDNSNVWFINYKGSDEIIMKALTMIINSVVFSVFGKCGANQASNGYYKFNKQFIEPIPLPNSKIVSSNTIIKKLAQGYNEIKELLLEFDKASPKDKDVYRGVLESKWEYIDDLCFELYQITPDERNLIESVGRVEDRVPRGDKD